MIAVMLNMLEWGVDVILWCQQFSPVLDAFFQFFTALGDEILFLLLVPMLYWCLDRRAGAHLLLLFFLSLCVNVLVKELADQPRPFQYDAQVRQLYPANGAGFPSGHTQNTVVVWGYLAWHFRRVWLWALAGLLLALVPLSRVYLGVHFPTDLVGGYVLGALLLWLYTWQGPRIAAWLLRKNLAGQVTVVLGATGFLLLLFPTGGAKLMGLSLGLLLERRWLGFEPGGVWRRRLLQFLLGAVVLVCTQAALIRLRPPLFYYIPGCVLLGLWIGLGAPWLFVHARLTGEH